MMLTICNTNYPDIKCIILLGISIFINVCILIYLCVKLIMTYY